MPTSPTATEIRAHLEGYNIPAAVISDGWIENERDYSVIPFVENLIRSSISAEQTVIEFYSGTGTDLLILDRKTINSLVAIELVSGTDVQSIINLSSTELIGAQGIIKIKSGISEYFNYRVFPKGNRNIKVSYKCGGTLSNEIKQAIIKLSCVLILDNLEGRTGGGSLTMQQFSRDYGNMGKYSNIRKRLNGQAMAILKRYSTSVIGS